MLNSRKLKQQLNLDLHGQARGIISGKMPSNTVDPVNTVNKFGRINGVAVLPGQGQISDTPYIPLTFRVQLCSLYCAFQKKANSEVQKPPS